MVRYMSRRFFTRRRVSGAVSSLSSASRGYRAYVRLWWVVCVACGMLGVECVVCVWGCERDADAGFVCLYTTARTQIALVVSAPTIKKYDTVAARGKRQSDRLYAQAQVLHDRQEYRL